MIDPQLELDIIQTELLCVLDECRISYDPKDITKIGLNECIVIKVTNNISLYLYSSIFRDLIGWGLSAYHKNENKYIPIVNPFELIDETMTPSSRSDVVALTVRHLVNLRISYYYNGSNL